MNTVLILIIILFALMILIGGRRGMKAFFTLIFNFLILFLMFIFINSGVDPIKVTIIFSVFISIVTLFYLNGINIKTIASLLSVIAAVLLTLLITYHLGTEAKIQGFGIEQSETLAFLSTYVQLNFSKVVFCEVLTGLLGAIIDVSISISASMYEIYKSNPAIKEKNLFYSGMNIGKDIMGTMANTLLFAYIGGFMTLIIYFNELHYTFSRVVNAKVFCSEVFQSLCGGIGIVLIIPITSIITCKLLSIKHFRKSHY